MSANPAELQTQDERHLLAMLKKGDSAIVTGLAEAANEDQAALKTRLLELGFAPGEKIRIVAEAFPRRDPIAVRLGNTTFALRRHEAAMIHVSRKAVALHSVSEQE